MSSNDYQFQTRWILKATAREVSDILQEPLELARWWPSVYLAVVQEGDVTSLRTRGFLPYRLRWSFAVTENRAPHGFSLKAWGDLEGHGVWTFREVSADTVEVVYDWTVTANKPILRHLSFQIKPVFQLNHDWAMEKGRKSLELELRRRRGEANVPPPPGPVNDALIYFALILFLWLAFHP